MQMPLTRKVEGAAIVVQTSRLLTSAALLLCVAAAHGQDWAKTMCDHTTHDFGVVARGAKVEHRFVIENIYEEDVHIKSVSSTCGCSTPTVNRQALKTWEKAEVLVTLDTRGFLGRKDSTIKVVLDQPFSAEIQLHIHAYIRSDIVVQPGSVALGAVQQGAGATQTLAVTYAGRDDWRIVRVECANPHIEATAAETSRTPGKAAYSLAVRLTPDAPAGYIRDQLVLVTNDYDTRASRVPVTLDGLVVSALSARPSPLMMGTVEPGQSVTRNLVIQGRAPFQILAMRCDDPRFQCKATSQSKATHVVPVTFSASNDKAPGETVSAKIQVETDLAGTQALEVSAVVHLAPAQTPKP